MKPNRAKERAADLLHWTWSCQLQLRRFEHSMNEEWSDYKGEADRRKVYSQTSFDEHVLFVALRNLVAALDRPGPRLPRPALGDSTFKIIKLLRNAYEHWPKERTKFQAGVTTGEGAVAALARNHSDVRPWSVDFTSEGLVLAGAINLNPAEHLYS